MSKSTVNIFYETECLSELTSGIRGLDIHKKWLTSRADKRQIHLYLEKFILYNENEFNFLGVTPLLIGLDQNVKLHFRTSCFIGAIPLKAPDTGKQIGDFIVSPRFINRDFHVHYFEILNLLGQNVEPEYQDSLPLISGNGFRPPMYFDAVKYISYFEELTKKSWNKFNRLKTLSREPTGQIDWIDYVNNLYKIEKQLEFPVWKNALNQLHTEYSQLKYVLNVCDKYVNSPSIPVRIRLIVKEKLRYIHYVTSQIPAEETKFITVRQRDSALIKSTKTIANKILSYNITDCPAWRLDFNLVFEKYVQYIFENFAKKYGGRVYKNNRISAAKGRSVPWRLQYLEPDLTLRKGDLTFYVDAKYKSNLYNQNSNSEFLKQEHRRDIHQILAYMSFDNSENKTGFLCYPSDKAEVIEISYRESLNEVKNKIFMLGIPIDRHKMNDVEKTLFDIAARL